MDLLIGLLIGLIIGAIVGFAANHMLKSKQQQSSREIAEQLYRENESLRKDDSEIVLSRIKESFGDLSLDALEKLSKQFLNLAGERFEKERSTHTQELDTKKGLIDLQLQKMTTELAKVSTVVNELEKDRENKFGELTKQIEETGKYTNELAKSTNSLREALAGSKSRGQWGERMAEDVLKIAGFIENVNYVKQKALSNSGTIPDFTFMLPRELILNMDVKFPFDNYLRYLETDSVTDRETYRKSFLRDVRQKMKEVATRDYIDPAHNTVDFVILFIPNEKIYSFIHEEDTSIIDDGIRQRVIICSPVTLFSVLAVIRAAVDNFSLQQTSNTILSLLGTFDIQWGRFVKSFKTLGARIDSVRNEYDNLTSTRTNQLEKPLRKIEEIRSQKNIAAADIDDVMLLNPAGEVDDAEEEDS